MEKKQFEGFIFTKISPGGAKVQFRIDNIDSTHSELAVEFTNFLRACGFVFDHLAVLELVSERDEEHSSYD